MESKLLYAHHPHKETQINNRNFFRIRLNFIIRFRWYSFHSGALYLFKITSLFVYTQSDHPQQQTHFLHFLFDRCLFWNFKKTTTVDEFDCIVYNVHESTKYSRFYYVLEYLNGFNPIQLEISPPTIVFYLLIRFKYYCYLFDQFSSYKH